MKRKSRWGWANSPSDIVLDLIAQMAIEGLEPWTRKQMGR